MFDLQQRLPRRIPSVQLEQLWRSAQLDSSQRLAVVVMRQLAAAGCGKRATAHDVLRREARGRALGRQWPKLARGGADLGALGPGSGEETGGDVSPPGWSREAVSSGGGSG